MILRFILYGLVGWCAEIIWTAGYDFVTGTRRLDGDEVGRVPLSRKGRWRLQARTYLWMLPIYGMAALFFEPVHNLVRPQLWIFRGLLYTIGLFLGEGFSGVALKQLTGACPWDYSYARWNIAGVVRLDYIPVWFAFGMILERVHNVLIAIEAPMRAAL